MNAKQLQEIEEREKKAPIGPWKVEDDEQGYCWIRIPDHDLCFGDMETTDGCCFYMAEFVAHAREDVPALVSEVKQLRTALEAIEWIKHPTIDAYICPCCGWVRKIHKPDCIIGHALKGRDE